MDDYLGQQIQEWCDQLSHVITQQLLQFSAKLKMKICHWESFIGTLKRWGHPVK